MSFSTAHPVLAAALAARGYTDATPVQAAVLAEEARGRDLLVSARTGSGKTVAFGLCLAEELLAGGSLPPAGAPLALVVAPTRELALQVRRELAWLWGAARVASCVGGMDIRREARDLMGGAHVVVGTPGRLCDHLERGTLRLGDVRAVVLDEADEMLDLGFREELDKLLEATPKERRTLLFSATLPDGILGLAGRHQRNALRIAATAAEEPHADIEHRAVVVAPREREHVVVNILRLVEAPTALVFCATREGVGHLHTSLVERGFTAVALSGELTQAERGRALQQLRDGRARVLVATDVAARGLDLPKLDLVVQADLPHDGQVLLHRAGRTGRAGRKGTNVLLVPVTRRRMADRLLREARLEPRWSPPPTADSIRAKDAERLPEVLTTALAEVTTEDRELGARLLASTAAEELAALVAHSLRAGWPEPEELPETDALHARRAPVRRPEEPRPVRAEQPGEPEPQRGPPVPERAAPAPRSFVPTEGRTPRRPGARPEGPDRRDDRRRPPLPQESEGGVWFRMNVGREQNADPRWLVPLICRRGRIDAGEIGAIRIHDGETRFEVRAEAAERFFFHARRPDRREPWVRFAPVM